MTSGPLQLCYITDRHGLAPRPLLPQIEAAVQAGVNLIQLREKDLPTRKLVPLADAVVRRSRGAATRIVINDRFDVAAGVGADGVHLSVQSLPPHAVRHAAGNNFLIGVSCHSLDEALGAEAGGASYILLGPIFETPSKLPYGPPLGLDKLSEVAGKIKIPVIALGGITVERVRACVKAGAAGVAGIRLFQDCSSLGDRVRELRDQFNG